MKRFHKIMVMVDHNQTTQPGLARALQMEHAPGTEIILFTNIYDSSVASNFILDPYNLHTVKESMTAYQQQKLKDLIKQNRRDNVTFKYDVVWQETGYISDLNTIDSYQPDLVIKSCRPESTLSQWLFNSANSQLLKACPCPILFVRNEHQQGQSTVLSAVDPGHKLSQSSQLDNNVLEAGSMLAESLQAPLHVCHCFDPSYWDIFLQTVKNADIWTEAFPAHPSTDKDKVLDDLREKHYDIFTETCEDWVPHREHRHFVNGSVEDTLPKLASQLNSSAVVLGTTYRTGFLGSTAETILRELEIDLLVVKPAGFVSPLKLNAG